MSVAMLTEEGQTQITAASLYSRADNMDVHGCRYSMTVFIKLHLYCHTGYLASQVLKSLLLYG